MKRPRVKLRATYRWSISRLLKFHRVNRVEGARIGPQIGMVAIFWGGNGHRIRFAVVEAIRGIWLRLERGVESGRVGHLEGSIDVNSQAAGFSGLFKHSILASNMDCGYGVLCSAVSWRGLKEEDDELWLRLAEELYCILSIRGRWRSLKVQRRVASGTGYQPECSSVET